MHFSSLILAVGPLLAGLTSAAPLPSSDLTHATHPTTLLVPIYNDEAYTSHLAPRAPGKSRLPKKKKENNDNVPAGSSRPKENLKKDFKDSNAEKQRAIDDKKAEIEEKKKNNRENLKWPARDSEIEQFWVKWEKSPAYNKHVNKFTKMFEDCMDKDKFMFWTSGGDHEFEDKVIKKYPNKDPIALAVSGSHKCNDAQMKAATAELKKELGAALAEVVEERTNENNRKTKKPEVKANAKDVQRGKRQSGYRYWTVLSAAYARAASGAVVFVRPDALRVHSKTVWAGYERPELKKRFGKQVTEVKEQGFADTAALVLNADGFYDPITNEDHDWNKVYLPK